MPVDVSTGVLIDEHGGHAASAAILRQFEFMGLPWTVLGPLGLLVPQTIRDGAYYAFARNRGTIWKQVKKTFGIGDTALDSCRDRILGLGLGGGPMPDGWGFTPAANDDATQQPTPKL